MTKKIDLMETGISLARLFRLAFRNWLTIGFSFVLGLGMAYGYTQSSLMDAGTYQATGSVSYRTATNATILTTITEIVRSSNVSTLAETALAEAEGPVTLSNGDPITAAIIRSTLTATSVTNSLKITITFTHPDEAIVIPVINAVIDATIADGNANYPVIANNLVLADGYATATTFDGPSTTLYLAIGALLGLMIGGTVGVLYDAFKGTIFTQADLRELTLSAFAVTLKTKIPFTAKTLLRRVGLKTGQPLVSYQRDQLLQGALTSKPLTTVQNNLESTRPSPNEALTTLITTPTPFKRLSTFTLAYGVQSALQGRKTLIIDFDLLTTPFTTYLNQRQIDLKKKPTTKTASLFQQVIPNLDVYLPEQTMVPAKVIRSQTIEALISNVKKQYDHVLIIGPSVLPDASILSMVGYANSALMLAQANTTTTTHMIKSVNALVDANLTAIESVIYQEQQQATFPYVKAWVNQAGQWIKKTLGSFKKAPTKKPANKKK